MENEAQQNLFEPKTQNAETENVLLYALGEFQQRGFELSGRKLPLDRLLGAFKRAFEKFDVAELSDEKIAETLGKLGAKIDKVPTYVAKHPFRITVFEELALKSKKVFEEKRENQDSDDKE